MFDNKYPYTDFHELNLDWFMGEFKKLVAEWEETRGEWNTLHDYVQNYFENLNVQTEIDNKINAMIADGTFADIVSPFVTAALPALVSGQLPDVVAAQISSVVAAQISAVVAAQLPSVAAAAAAAEVGDWLTAHIDPDTGYVIDDTLTVQGAAADAKAAGDVISILNNDLYQSINIERGNNLLNPNTIVTDTILTSSGAEDENSNYVTTDFIDVNNITTINVFYNSTGTGSIVAYNNVRHLCFYDANKDFISGSHEDTQHEGPFTVFTGARYVRFSIVKMSWQANYFMVSNIDDEVPTTFIPYGIVSRTLNDSPYITIEDVAAMEFMKYGVLFESGADLDDATDGIQISNSNALTNSLINCPVANANCTVITFTRISTYKMQICIGGNGRLYYRTSGGSGYTVWKEMGDHIEKLTLAPREGVTPQYGEEVCPELSTFSGTDATWDGEKWTFVDGGVIASNVTVDGESAYLIEFTVSDPYTGADSDGVPAYLTVTLGNDEVTFFAANDAYWYITMKPTNSGSVPFSVQSVNHWTGKISAISIKPITRYVPSMMELYIPNVYYVAGGNLGIGGLGGMSKGVQNTGFGQYAQIGLESARWNTALGNSSQRCLRNGTGNTAIGASSQSNMVAGCYNNAVGNATQTAITNGNWNNAFGNEAQLELTTGCNNVNIGRRSGTAMRTGNYNTHVGTWTGFTGVNTTPGVDDNRNTISASFQTLVGGRAMQIDHQSDYLTAVGFESKGDENAVAVGARAIAKGENSVAIGYGVETTNDNQVAIGSTGQTIILAGKVITFNPDNTVTWTTL